MVSFVSALLGGVSIAGTAFNNERRQDELLAQKYREEKTARDEDNAARYKIALLSANSTLAAAHAKAGKPPAGSQLINVPDFSIAGTGYKNNSFRLTAPTDNSRLEQLQAGLNVAYRPLVDVYKTVGTDLGMTQPQFDNIWSTVGESLLSHVSRVWRERSEPQLAKGLRPAAALELVGSLAKIPQVRDHIRKLNNSRLTGPQQKRVEDYGNVRSRFGEDSGRAETWGMTVDSRVTDRPLQSVAQKAFGPEAYTAMNNYNRTGNSNALISSISSIVRERMPDAEYTPEQIVEIAAEIDFLHQNAKVVESSTYGYNSMVNPGWKERDPEAGEKKRDSATGVRGDLLDFVVALRQGADVTNAATIRSVYSTVVGTARETAGIAGDLLRNLIPRGETFDESIANNTASAVSNSLVEDLTAQRLALSPAKARKFGVKTDNLIDFIKKSDAEVAELLEGKQVQDLDTKALATYNLHMARVSLAFRYSKFLQGGTGGNAVSNADFQNTMKALFGTFSGDPEEQRVFLINMAMNLDIKIRQELDETNQIEKYSITMPTSEGSTKLYDARTPFIKKLGEDSRKKLEDLKYGRGAYANIPVQERQKMYWDAVAGESNIAVPNVNAAGAAGTGDEDRADNEFGK